MKKMSNVEVSYDIFLNSKFKLYLSTNGTLVSATQIFSGKRREPSTAIIEDNKQKKKKLNFFLKNQTKTKIKSIMEW